MPMSRAGAIVFAACSLLLWCAVPAAPTLERETADYGSWTSRPPSEWPRITLINQIDYTNEHHPTAACGFLIDTGDKVVAATAKHVLRFFKSAVMDSVSFEGTLKSWRMFPKDSPSDIVIVDRLINEDPDERLDDFDGGRDWLLFTVAERSTTIQPLRLRTTPLRKGEPVFVIGWRYPDEGRQRIHEGSFVRSESGTVLISVHALADNKIPGLSGSPVIDAQGYVVGLMSRKAGKLQRLSSVDYPRALLDAESRR